MGKKSGFLLPTLQQAEQLPIAWLADALPAALESLLILNLDNCVKFALYALFTLSALNPMPAKIAGCPVATTPLLAGRPVFTP